MLPDSLGGCRPLVDRKLKALPEYIYLGKMNIIAGKECCFAKGAELPTQKNPSGLVGFYGEEIMPGLITLIKCFLCEKRVEDAIGSS